MNKAFLFGRLTRDPEVRYTQSNMAVCRFNVAVDRRMTKKKREQAQANGAPTADFINCQAFGSTAENIGKYFSKGRKIIISGHIQTGSYQNKEGRTVYTTDVIVDEFGFPESASQQQGYQQNTQQYYQQPQSVQYAQPVQYAQSQYQQPPVQYQPPQQPPVQPPAQQQISMDDELPSGFIEIDEDDIPF